MNTKVLLVDDHPMLRRGMSQTIAEQPNLAVVGEASTGAEALKLAGELQPDVVVVDLHLPDMDGIEVTRRVLEVLPTAKVVVFSADASPAQVDAAIQAGARGYIWKQSALDDLLRAIEIASTGKLYLSPELSAGILEDYRRTLQEKTEPSKPLLTERDRQLLRLIAGGQRNKEIAVHLGLSPKSIEAYRSRLMKKLGCSGSADLVRYAIREGIAPA